MDYNIDAEWDNFITYSEKDNTKDDELIDDTNEYMSANIEFLDDKDVPNSSNIYISTKTKISYLNQQIDLNKIFWEIPIIEYEKPCEGVIKKQIKFNSFKEEELEAIQEKLQTEKYFEENIITHINNPTGRIKFKDTRKISIGISKKDLISFRCKKKSAFYNCFVLIIRIKIEDSFKEFHVKVFNTGKLEIPGIQCEEIFDIVLSHILIVLKPYVNENLNYIENSNETVLINSNFNCGYFINREALYELLIKKYNIQSIYDPCSYPGIQCKFYYNEDIAVQNGCQISEENKYLYKNIQDVSFMIFRTGSVLIVGKCDLNVLTIIYDYLKNIFKTEYNLICQKKITNVSENILNKNKKKKIRKKIIIIDVPSPKPI
jgi:hypothetical protein